MAAFILPGFNATEWDELPEPCSFKSSNSMNWALSSYFYPFICLLGFMGNLVIIGTFCFKTKPNPSKPKLEVLEVFQVNLAITNLLFTVALAILIYNELLSWPMGQAACKLLQGSYSINLYGGTLLVAGMSVVHFVSIFFPLSCWINSIGTKDTSIICMSIWVFALLLSVPTFYFYQLYEPTSETIHMLEGEKHSNSSASPQFVCEFQFKDQDLSQIVKVAVPSVQMAVGFFLPLLIILFCYTSIITKLLTNKFKPITGRPSDASGSNPRDNRLKAVGTVTWIMLVFVSCHLPYNLILLYDTVTMFQERPCEEADRWHAALAVTECIAYLQCCLNPVIYGFIGKNFRKTFRKTFCSTNKSEDVSLHPFKSTKVGSLNKHKDAEDSDAARPLNAPSEESSSIVDLN